MGSFSRGYGYRFDIGGYFPRAIKTICLACVGVFVLQELSQLIFGDAGRDFWLTWFGLVPLRGDPRFPALAACSRICFSMVGFWHILMNLLFLAMFGADLEHTWGSRKFYTYYFPVRSGSGRHQRHR